MVNYHWLLGKEKRSRIGNKRFKKPDYKVVYITLVSYVHHVPIDYDINVTLYCVCYAHAHCIIIVGTLQ